MRLIASLPVLLLVLPNPCLSRGSARILCKQQSCQAKERG